MLKFVSFFLARNMLLKLNSPNNFRDKIILSVNRLHQTPVVELADTLDLGSSADMLAGSSPVRSIQRACNGFDRVMKYQNSSVQSTLQINLQIKQQDC